MMLNQLNDDYYYHHQLNPMKMFWFDDVVEDDVLLLLFELIKHLILKWKKWNNKIIFCFSLPAVRMGWTSGNTDWFPKDISVGVSCEDETTVIGKQRRWRLDDDVLDSYGGEFVFESRSCSNERFNVIHEAIEMVFIVN